MHELLINQNNLKMAALLEASSMEYRSAKTFELWVSRVLIFLSIAYPIVYLVAKDPIFKNTLFAFSFILTVLVLIFSDKIKGNTTRGALYKEEFDTLLFGLRWKNTLEHPIEHDAFELSYFYYKKQGMHISDWYSTNISPNLPNYVVIALAQYSNSTWDKALRQKYLDMIYIGIGLYTLTLLIILFVTRQQTLTIFLVFFSLLSFYSHFITIIRGHISVINKRNILAHKLDKRIRSKHYISSEELRDFQDEIYLTRKETAKVPDRFFKSNKKEMNDIIEEYITEINKLYLS